MATPMASSALSMRTSLCAPSAQLRSSRGRAVQAKRCAVAPLAAIREIFMPALSSTMTEGKIVSWLKSEGDKVRPLGLGEGTLRQAAARGAWCLGPGRLARRTWPRPPLPRRA